MIVFAALATFWAIGSWALWAMVAHGLGPAAQYERGWTAYAPLTEESTFVWPGAGLWGLITLWLAVMLTVTAVAAWVSVLFAARREHRRAG